MTDSDGNCDLLGSRQVVSCIRLSFLKVFCVSLLLPAELSCDNSSYQLSLDTPPGPLQGTFYLPCLLLLLSLLHFGGFHMELGWLGNSKG